MIREKVVLMFPLNGSLLYLLFDKKLPRYPAENRARRKESNELREFTTVQRTFYVKAFETQQVANANA